MKAPFIWFGGKRRVADVVWSALGDVDNYVEPFAGSLAVLLERPNWHRGRIDVVHRHPLMPPLPGDRREEQEMDDDHNPEWQARLRREREQQDRVPEPHDEEPRRFRVRPMFAWYDFWVGVFYDRRKSALYVFPVPMLGVRVSWGGME